MKISNDSKSISSTRKHRKITKLFISLLLAAAFYTPEVLVAMECKDLFDEPASQSLFDVLMDDLMGDPPSKNIGNNAIPVIVENVLSRSSETDWGSYAGRVVDVHFEVKSKNKAAVDEMKSMFGSSAEGSIRLRVETFEKFAKGYGSEGQSHMNRFFASGVMRAMALKEVAIVAIKSKGRWYFSEVIEGLNEGMIEQNLVKNAIGTLLKANPDIDRGSASLHVLHTHPESSPFTLQDRDSEMALGQFYKFKNVIGVAVDASGLSSSPVAFVYKLPAR